MKSFKEILMEQLIEEYFEGLIFHSNQIYDNKIFWIINSSVKRIMP
jgi:hypothetical protein